MPCQFQLIGQLDFLSQVYILFFLSLITVNGLFFRQCRYSRSSRGHSIVGQKFQCLNPANINRKCIQITYKKAYARALFSASTAVKKPLSCTAYANRSRVRPYLSTNTTVFDRMTAFYFFHQSTTSHSAWKWDTTKTGTNTAPASRLWCFLTFKCLTMQVWCFLIQTFICNLHQLFYCLLDIFRKTLLGILNQLFTKASITF